MRAGRIETPAGVAVISGDTRACDEVERLASAGRNGCGVAAAADILVHEACLPRLMSNSHSAVSLATTVTRAIPRSFQSRNDALRHSCSRKVFCLMIHFMMMIFVP